MRGATMAGRIEMESVGTPPPKWCNLGVAPGIKWSSIKVGFRRPVEDASPAPRRRWVEGTEMKNSTCWKILFSFLAVIALFGAPNPAFAQRGGGGHGGGGGGSHGGGGGGGFHGGGGGGGHYSGGGGGGHYSAPSAGRAY